MVYSCCNIALNKTWRYPLDSRTAVPWLPAVLTVRRRRVEIGLNIIRWGPSSRYRRDPTGFEHSVPLRYPLFWHGRPSRNQSLISSLNDWHFVVDKQYCFDRNNRAESTDGIYFDFFLLLRWLILSERFALLFRFRVGRMYLLVIQNVIFKEL